MKKLNLYILSLLLIYSFLLGSCNSIQYRDDSNILINDIEYEIEKTKQVDDHFEITKTPIIEPSSDSNTDYLDIELDNENSNSIGTITDDVIVYQNISTNSEKKVVFSELDFSIFNINKNNDLKKNMFSSSMLIYEFNNVNNIRLYNNYLNLIYISNENINRNKYLYKYDVISGISKIVSGQGVYFARIAPDENRILYTDEQRRLFVIDFSGSGIEYASDILLSPYTVFSPNGEYIAFVGEARNLPNGCLQDDNYVTDLFLYFISIDEPNNPIKLNTLPLLEGKCGKALYGNLLSWLPDSNEIIYVREIEDGKMNVCGINILKNEEICDSKNSFSVIDAIVPYDNDLIVLSGRLEPVDHEKCVVCSIEQMNTDIYIVDIISGEIKNITNTPYSEVNPLWVENNKYIMYESFKTGTRQIFITDSNGSFHEQLTYSDIDTYLYQK